MRRTAPAKIEVGPMHSDPSRNSHISLRNDDGSFTVDGVYKEYKEKLQHPMVDRRAHSYSSLRFSPAVSKRPAKPHSAKSHSKINLAIH